MPPRDHPRHPHVMRGDLPEDLTPEAISHLDFRTLRALSKPDNGILDAADQAQFDASLREVVRGTASVLSNSIERSRRGGPGNLDPEMRRSYARTQERLAQQVQRGWASLPGLEPDVAPEPEKVGDPGPTAPVPSSPGPTTPVPPTVSTTHDDGPDDGPDDGDGASPNSLALEVEQTSDTLDMLERIASLQERQLEDRAQQVLSDTRGLFFAFVVSVAVIVAGVAPLVEAEPHDRFLTLLWTLITVAVAGLVYLVVRALQAKR